MNSALGIVLYFAITPAQQLPAVEATLAWGGAVSSDAFTEVSLSAGRGADFAVTTTGGSPSIGTRLKSQHDQPAAASMPLLPGESGLVTLAIEDGHATLLRAGGLRRGSAPVVLVGDSVFVALPDLPDSIVVATSDLPRLASAYENIRSLVIDGSALARLDELQLKALLEHVGTCGRVLLVDVARDVEQTLAQRAGCGGQTVAGVAPDADVHSQLEALLDLRIAAMPDARVLGRLADKSMPDLRLMMLFLAGFLLVFGMLTLFQRTRIVASGFCLFATALAAVLWNSEPRAAFVAWSEVSNGERIARYAGIERLMAGGRGKQTLRPESLGRTPREISGQGLAVHWSAAAADRHLDWNAALLEEARIVTAGSFPIEPNLRAGVSDATATVCNYGSATSPPSWLRWRGSTYAVPALAPAGSWTLNEAQPVSASRPELRMLARRMQQDSLALLQPLRVPGNGGMQQAWLLRLESEGSSPCTG